jgi:hypothetical protein
VATFVPELQNPDDPESVAEWARIVASKINGQISIGEPVSEDTTLKPNGVKGHLLGSFVEVVIGTNDLNTAMTCTHNLNLSVWGTDLNVGWIIVRAEHSGTGAAVNSTISCNFQTGDTIGANAIELRFYADTRTVTDGADALTVHLWFFPATR